MRQNVIKFLIFCGISALLLLSFSVRYSRHDMVNNILEHVSSVKEVTRDIKPIEETAADKSLKYILQWTNPHVNPFKDLGVGREGFISRGCKYTNCYVTADRNYLGDVTKFDVIAFNGPDVRKMDKSSLPAKRTPHQKYAFGTIESAQNYPVCTDLFDGFFNWTWTYRLDSDSRWGYIVVRDKNDTIIGPNKEMHWIKSEDMLPVNDELKSVLKGKSKAAAWFVSNCVAISRREKYANQLNEHLQKYNMTVDIYGQCGKLKCSRKDELACDKMIEKDYFFYLSFENSFCEDYVTEKLLHALEFNAVPVVYGGANYTRFMPDGMYLDATKLSPEELAVKMNELINKPDKYSEYFKWKNHYRYHRRRVSVDTNDYCAFCALINDEEKVKQETVYEDFNQWWNPPDRCFMDRRKPTR